MNALDFLIIAVIVLSAIAGIRRGFILGAFEVLMAILGLGMAVLFYDEFASVLGHVLDVSDAVLNIAGFVFGYALVQVPGFLLLRPLMRWFRRAFGVVPGIHPADRAAGALPGAIQGLVVTYVIVLALGFFSTATRAGSALEESRFGLSLFREGTATVLQVANRTGFEFSDFYAIRPRPNGETHVFPFELDAHDLQVDLEAEARMIALVNEERTARGLQPLEPDPALAAVGRAHAVEMFSEGYFAHQSPRTGSPFDRLSAAGIAFGAAGENLAFAPDVEQAHQGLMDSEGHRENILEPAFGRIGIGAISSPDHGTIYVQMFTD